MTVMVKKVGGSVAVVIPKSMAREMGLVEGTPLDISTTKNTIVMRTRPRRARRPLSSIVKQIDPKSYRRRSREFPEGGPVGREVW